LSLGTILLAFLISAGFFTINAQAQEKEMNINQNSLVACVDHISNSMKELNTTNFFKESSIKIMLTMVCNLGYEHTGQYSHLLPKDMINKYIEMAVIKATIEKIPID